MALTYQQRTESAVTINKQIREHCCDALNFTFLDKQLAIEELATAQLKLLGDEAQSLRDADGHMLTAEVEMVRTTLLIVTQWGSRNE